MSVTVNLADAKTRLSELLDRASCGEEIVIVRRGRPIARLVAWSPPVVERKPGRMRGRVRIARDFDAPLPAGLFEGKGS